MTTLNIKEMSCNHCVQRIDTLLEGLKVEHSVKLEDKTVTITDDAAVDLVIDELSDIGFTATRA